MWFSRYFWAGAMVGCLSIVARAEVRFANVFNDHMVLQRGKPLNVWGFATPGERIEVSFADAVRETTADMKGDWCVTFAPLAASRTGRELKASGPFNSVSCTDVLVGDVWLAAGQSNMEYDLHDQLNVKKDFLARFDEAVKDGRIRGTTANHTLSLISTAPLDDLTERATWGTFASGVSQVFALALSDGLDGEVPIGMYVGAERGNRIEAYISKAAWEASPWDGKYWYLQVARDVERRPDSVHTNPPGVAIFGADGKANSNTPACKWNVLYEPVRRMAVTGAIWYQGESNGGEPIGNYQAKLEALIDGWRTAFGSDIAFGLFSLNGGYFAPGARYQGAVGYATVNCAQTRVANRRKLVGIGSIWDTGNDVGGLHPIDKISAGQRVANWALRHVCGKPVAVGPRYKAHTFSGNTATVSFHDAEKGFASATRDSTNYFVPERLATPITGFGLRDAENGTWDWASKVVVNGDNTITVTRDSAGAVDGVAYFGCCGELGSCYSGAETPQPLACFSTEVSTYPMAVPGRIPVASPFGPAMKTTVPWSGTDQRPSFPVSDDYAITSAAGEWKDVGVYAATATLKGETCWVDGTTEPKRLTFNIVPAPNRWIAEPAVTKTMWKEDAAPAKVLRFGTPSFGSAGSMTVKDADGNPAPGAIPTAKGHWFLTFAVPATARYAGVEKTIEISIIGADERVSGVADETPTAYSWTAGSGSWETPAKWSVPGTEPYFGYPNDAPASAVFKDLSAPVSVTASGTRQLSALAIVSSDVTISGGICSNATLTLAGAKPRLALTGGAILQAMRIAPVPSATTLELSGGSQLSAAVNVRGVQDLVLTGEQSVLDGDVSIFRTPSARVKLTDCAVRGALSCDSSDNAEIVLSGKGCLTSASRRPISFSGTNVLASFGADVAVTAFSAVAGDGATIRFAGKETRFTGGVFCTRAKDGTIEFAPGADVTIDNSLGFRAGHSLAFQCENCAIVINDAKVTAKSIWNDHGKSSRLEFRGAAPVLAAGGSRQPLRFGSEEPEADDVPSLVFVLPFQPYEKAPLQLDAMFNARNAVWTTDHFYPNVPIVLDLTGFAGDGAVPLVENAAAFATAIAKVPERTVEGLIAALTARLKVVCDGKDASARVKLALSQDRKVLSAEISRP